MAVESDDDRAGFVDPDEFGVAVVWTREGVGQTPFNAVFNRPTRTVDGLAEVSLYDRAAFLYCAEASLPDGAIEGDPVTVEGETATWHCKAIRPDGSGFVVVDLGKA